MTTRRASHKTPCDVPLPLCIAMMFGSLHALPNTSFFFMVVVVVHAWSIARNGIVIPMNFV